VLRLCRVGCGRAAVTLVGLVPALGARAGRRVASDRRRAPAQAHDGDHAAAAGGGLF